MSEAFGIDFGTTNSVLARATATGVETITLDDQLPGEWAGTGFDKVLPSVIGIRAGDKPTFGWIAKTQPTGRLEAVKRLFATDDVVSVGGTTLKVEEAGAIFFRHIQQQAARSGIIKHLDHAVVTIPANSRGRARFRTKLSAGLAGIEVACLMNEPTAAAMAHARLIRQDQRILVFDWGGGTLDVTLLKSFDGSFIEESSKGIQRLGGIDVDNAFLASLLTQIPDAPTWAEHERNLFRLNLERAKIALSTSAVAQVALPRGGLLEVTRPQFEAAIMPLVERTREPVELCLRERHGEIDHLLMVGGSSKMPVIRRFIEQLVGVEPSDAVDAMTAVGEGAAIAAAIMQGIITDLDFYVGTEHALGTVVHGDMCPPEGRFSVLIPRNMKYPAEASDKYTALVDYAEQLILRVIEGDPAKPVTHEDNVILKEWPLKLLDRRLIRDSAFQITYHYDLNGILRVTVVDEMTKTVMMDEEMMFGAAQARSQLQLMRRRVDELMDDASARLSEPAPEPPPTALGADSVTAVIKARTKVIPVVSETERHRLEELVRVLEAGTPEREAANLEALQRELRNHAYLL